MPDNTSATFGGVDGKTQYADGIDVGLPVVRDPSRCCRLRLRVRIVVYQVPLQRSAHHRQQPPRAWPWRRPSPTPGTPPAPPSCSAMWERRRPAGSRRGSCGASSGSNSRLANPRPFSSISTPGDLAQWSDASNSWIIAPGTYHIWVGRRLRSRQSPLVRDRDPAQRRSRRQLRPHALRQLSRHSAVAAPIS